MLDVPKTGRAGSLRLCVVRPAVVGHEHLDVRVIVVDLAEAVQVPHEVVLVQEIPSRKWGAGKTPIIVSRIAKFPVIFHVDGEEAVECHRQNFRAPKLLGEDYGGGGLGDKVREGLDDAVTRRREDPRDRHNLAVLDVPFEKSCRPVVAYLLYKSFLQRLDEVLVGQPEDAADGDRGVRIAPSKGQRTSTKA